MHSCIKCMEIGGAVYNGKHPCNCGCLKVFFDDFFNGHSNLRLLKTSSCHHVIHFLQICAAHLNSYNLSKTENQNVVNNYLLFKWNCLQGVPSKSHKWYLCLEVTR